MKKKIWCGFLVFSLLLPLTASAFDGQRKGFMLNLGAGMGNSWLNSPRYSRDGFGICTDFKIGGGPSNKWHIYYSNRALWWKPSSTASTRVSGMTAIGVSTYLQPEAPSLYFTGALGLGVIASSSGSGSSSNGPGGALGFGYEFSRHFVWEVNILYADVGYSDIVNLTVTIGWLAY